MVPCRFGVYCRHFGDPEMETGSPKRLPISICRLLLFFFLSLIQLDAVFVCSSLSPFPSATLVLSFLTLSPQAASFPFPFYHFLLLLPSATCSSQRPLQKLILVRAYVGAETFHGLKPPDPSSLSPFPQAILRLYKRLTSPS